MVGKRLIALGVLLSTSLAMAGPLDEFARSRQRQPGYKPPTITFRRFEDFAFLDRVGREQGRLQQLYTRLLDRMLIPLVLVEITRQTLSRRQLPAWNPSRPS